MSKGSTQFRVRLDDDTAKIVRDLAERLDRPCSKVLAELVTDARPLMEVSLSIIDATDRAHSDAKAQLLDRLMGLESSANDFLQSFDEATTALHGEAHRMREEKPASDAEVRASRARRDGGRPPSTNRGVVKEKRKQVTKPKTGKS